MFKFIFIFLFSIPASAEVFLGYSHLSRLEKKSSNQEYEVGSRNSFYLGYVKEKWKGQLQYSDYDVSASNGNSTIAVDSFEWMAWAKYLLPIGSAETKYYAGLGLGLTWDKIDTTLAGDTVSSRSDREIVLGAIAEFDRYLLPNFSMGMDFKVIYSQYYSQRPTIELGLGNLTYYF
jgi:hypothetical protein